jgi:hypothetical protein
MWKLELNKVFKNNNKLSLFGREMIALIVLSIFIASPALAFDFSGWDGLLKKNVEPKVISGVKLNAVNYKSIQKDPAYAKLIGDLKSYNLSGLKSKDEKLAFWINVYNIMAIKMVLDNYPVKSIKDAGSLFKSVWKKDVGVVAGKKQKLNDIEHEILRKMGDPRIHVAIVCASVSCPDLRAEAYTPAKLSDQLDDQLKLFLINQGKGLKVDSADNKLYLSSIFKWFEEDFESEGGVVPFLSNYADSRYMTTLKSGKLKTKYLHYDWGLNEL